MSSPTNNTRPSSRPSSPAIVSGIANMEVELQYPSEPSVEPLHELTVEATPRPELKLITTTVPTAPNSPRSQSPQSPTSTCSSASLLTPSTSYSFDSPVYPLSGSLKLSVKPRSPFSSGPIRPPPPPLPYPIVSKVVSTSSALRPDPHFAFPPKLNASGLRNKRSISPTVSQSSDGAGPSSSTITMGRMTLTHPYARLQAKNDASGSTKRRKMWNHALEKSIFTPQELSNMSAPNRRTIYTATLENHVEQLHQQLLDAQLYPIPIEELEQYRGLNSKTAKSMVAGLQKDYSDLQLKKLELERANNALRTCLMDHGVPINLPVHPASQNSAVARRHSVDTSPALPGHYQNFFAPK
ncbi:unnamed protein product [Somion occarium]|uniref:Uncharacterized protein n=2 Tax=Somion occarium TaxID=3059160 RepID=A0ABP1CLC5_9APHY